MRSHAATRAPAPPMVHDVLRSPGRPLEPGVRGEMEARFGHDFSSVRVHDDGRAAESARAVSASAYTVGSDVVFDAGRYAPGSKAGDDLLAHEVGHVIQQGAVSTVPATLPVSPADSPLERDARVPSGRAEPQVQRQTADEERRAAVAEAEAVAATMGLDEEEEAEEAALLTIAERAPDPRFLPGGFTDEDIYGEYEAAKERLEEELAPAKDPRPFRLRFKQAQKEALDRPILSHDEGGSHESIWRYGLSKGLFAERERTLVAETLLAPYTAKAERSRKQWEAKRYRAQINRFRQFRSQLNLGFIQGALLGRPGVPPVIRGAYFSYGVAHTGVEAYRGIQAGDPTRVVGAALPLVAGYGFHRIAGVGQPPPGFRGLPPVGRVLNPQRGKPIEIHEEHVLAAYATEPALVKKMGSDAWAQAIWEIQGGEGVHPMAWKHPYSRVVYLNETRWTRPLSEINQPHELVTTAPSPPATGAALPSPAAVVAAPVLPMRPGTVTLEASRQNGLVKPGGKLESVLQSIESEFATARPTNLNQSKGVVDRATHKVGLASGVRSQPDPSHILLKNIGGIETRVYTNGEIVVTNKAGQVVLHLIP
ncbi:MAG TPA: DUF4157 domain-containing protein [Gaiellaceae bacterium]|nr:DUF4157 domain-containing protein [Gaiellaceae bacterium]